MNNNFCIPIIRKFRVALILTSCLFMISACAGSARFNKSSIVPAAEGSVKIKKDNNNNYKIDISIMRLADPKRLQPPKNTYVAWIVTQDQGLKNIGRLHSSSGFLSKTMKASLNTVTSLKPVRILITAEENGSVQHPGSQVVLTTNTLK
ncbi:hypothetical protein [Niastella populi]|uniref:Anti-sigma factor n=1 Tax=Niastella populi TaxID=550983 RepID=A0A1V9EZZ1_9BACT|nr:hypothetical protein [Niastella populi]OQP51713.1 hypothetical protein A4R26_29495 [Niastella populi]